MDKKIFAMTDDDDDDDDNQPIKLQVTSYSSITFNIHHFKR